MFHDAAPPRHRGRFASMSTTTSSVSNQRRPLQQQKRTKSSASWRRRTKICVVALGVFVVFVNVVVFSRDSGREIDVVGGRAYHFLEDEKKTKKTKGPRDAAQKDD